jgi:UDP-N-acetylmuramoylalanine--D-glutamate ligase
MPAQAQWDWAVVGLGDSGYAAACHLAATGARIAVFDTRDHPPNADALRRDQPQIPIITGPFKAQDLADASGIVLSPGVDPRHPALQAVRDRGQPVIGEIELFARAVTAPVIGITGSNGKTTVTRMVAAMAEQAGINVAAGGNLGPPALALLDRHPDAGLFVLELSSFQLETTQSLHPQVAAVLNLSPDHLDRYEAMADYAAAKARIFRNAERAVVNADDPRVSAMPLHTRDVRRFAMTHGDWRLEEHAGEGWLTGPGGPLLRAMDLMLVGAHNTLNALAALAIGDAAGFDHGAMATALQAFAALAHRTESLGWHDGCLWINDSKATNVAATLAAVGGMSRPVVLIAGGDGKGQGFAPLADALRGRARAAILFGRDAAAIARVLEETLPVTSVPDLDAAIEAAREQSRPGDAVVLSPACASFDQFADYRARGDHFRRRVEAMVDG